MASRPKIAASSLSEAVKSAAHYIEDEVFKGRSIRIGFSEKRLSAEFGPRLVNVYVIAPGEANHIHNYPLTIAAWALVEGRIIAWPQEESVACDFARVGKLGKLEGLDPLINNDRLINAPPYLARTVDVASLKRAFAARELTLRAFYQDWNGWSPISRYTQFISVPVPVLREVPEPSTTEEYGVFNIDTFEHSPLLDESTEGPLSYASEIVTDVYRRFRPETPPIT